MLRLHLLRSLTDGKRRAAKDPGTITLAGLRKRRLAQQHILRKYHWRVAGAILIEYVPC